MTKHSVNNERIKRQYFAFLKDAKGNSEPTVDAAAKAINRFESYGDIAAKATDQRMWSDLFQLETCVAALQPEAELRRSSWAIRAKYRDIAGDETYKLYVASNPPDAQSAKVEELRADNEHILREFHWVYAFSPIRERLRNSLSKWVFGLTVIFVAIPCTLALVAYYHPPKPKKGEVIRSVPVLPVIMAMGAVGGYVSLQRRIQAVPATGDPIVTIGELSNSRFSVYLAPISGAVFAALLYIVFVGGLLAGPLFPSISTPPGTCDVAEAASPPPPVTKTQEDESKCFRVISFSDFVSRTGPASGRDFGIVLVWSFIAGFAERFVPDTIDRLVNQASKAK